MIHLKLFNLEYISYFIPLDVTSTTETVTVRGKTSKPDVTSESALLPACVKCIHTKFMFIFASYSRLIPRTCVTLYVWVSIFLAGLLSQAQQLLAAQAKSLVRNIR